MVERVKKRDFMTFGEIPPFKLMTYRVVLCPVVVSFEPISIDYKDVKWNYTMRPLRKYKSYRIFKNIIIYNAG
ncbi:hypothetical protein GCM10022209_30850 [Chitinophaga oryziterrae]